MYFKYQFCIGDTRIGILVSILVSQEAVSIKILSLPFTASYENTDTSGCGRHYVMTSYRYMASSNRTYTFQHYTGNARLNDDSIHWHSSVIQVEPEHRYHAPAGLTSLFNLNRIVRMP